MLYKIKDFWDEYSELFYFLFVLIFIISSFVSLLIFVARKSCEATYENYYPQYSFISGCRIEWKGKLTPVDMVKNINI